MSIVTDIFLPLALAFIMFALGLGLTGADFFAFDPRFAPLPLGDFVDLEDLVEDLRIFILSLTN